MSVKGTGELFSKDEEGRFHKIHDATNAINEWVSTQQVIDKSLVDMFKPMEFTASFVVDENKLRMANAKDVTPVTEDLYE